MTHAEEFVNKARKRKRERVFVYFGGARSASVCGADARRVSVLANDQQRRS